ncbi:RICIN domain-containing protein [Streptomyces catenulae]|uniref:Ricin-type beta-trefoil lectin domain protein n=1 Tax=Streptomyces catenulae TaxID=66875 RepID=A0ABV2YX17_9ACTN|nr:ricin-type beta-trefoil lectin domain protein [Streptomyces catenulae]
MHRLSAFAVGVSIAATLVSTPQAALAQSSDESDGPNAAIYSLRNVATRNCVDNDPNWSGVITRGCNGGNNQRFEERPGKSNGYVLLKNLATGNCLDNDTYQGHIMARGCNADNEYQNWTRVGATLRNLKTGACLDDDPNHKYLLARGCNGGTNQDWEFPTR